MFRTVLDTPRHAKTGAVEIVHFVAVDDVGRAVNPMILQ
jgi:CO/xanthine dehydrogenase Mo-binding subunit